MHPCVHVGLDRPVNVAILHEDRPGRPCDHRWAAPSPNLTSTSCSWSGWGSAIQAEWLAHRVGYVGWAEMMADMVGGSLFIHG